MKLCVRCCNSVYFLETYVQLTWYKILSKEYVVCNCCGLRDHLYYTYCSEDPNIDNNTRHCIQYAKTKHNNNKNF